jgi:hypothetical protein
MPSFVSRRIKPQDSLELLYNKLKIYASQMIFYSRPRRKIADLRRKNHPAPDSAGTLKICFVESDEERISA